MQTNLDKGLVSLQSRYSFDKTLERLLTTLEAKGVTVFATIDHSGEAEQAGMEMMPTKVVIFGNPKAGTPVMIASPSVAIDLPLKMLISEDAEGQVWVTYDSSEYLQARHNVPDELIQNIAMVRDLAAKVAE